MTNLSGSNKAGRAEKTKQVRGAEQDRQQRQSKTLRENLLKRKQQRRSRQQQQLTTINKADSRIKGL